MNRIAGSNEHPGASSQRTILQCIENAVDSIQTSVKKSFSMLQCEVADLKKNMALQKVESAAAIEQSYKKIRKDMESIQEDYRTTLVTSCQQLQPQSQVFSDSIISTNSRVFKPPVLGCGFVEETTPRDREWLRKVFDEETQIRISSAEEFLKLSDDIFNDCLKKEAKKRKRARTLQQKLVIAKEDVRIDGKFLSDIRL